MRFYLIVILSCVVGRFYSQTANVIGSVQNEKSAQFVKEAIILIGNKSIVTDSNGFFKAAIQINKPVTITVKHVGYKSFSQKLSVTKDTVLTFFIKSDLIYLEEITIQAEKDNSFGISRLNNVEGTTIYAGKKSEAIYVQDLNANLAANSSRQIFSKIPGINVFENDGTGSTIGIGGRGLDPNRVTNFNTRQNGYDISADALGYPESYYTPPTEAIDRIEILRGAAGLQFGTQFGGMINYKFAEAPLDKKISGNFRQTGGSYGFLNSFNQLSGTFKKVSYNTFYQYKHYNGWRSRSELNNHNTFASLKYQITEKLFIKGEYTHLNYVSQQPGGLTDKQFSTNNSIVNRNRNWFKVNWNLTSLTADYKISERTQINFLSFGLLAGRDALGVLIRPDRADDTTTNRNLLSDTYKNYGAELRVLHRYYLFKQNSHVLIGARYYKGNTYRKQGDADKSSEANFRFLNPNNLENSSYIFPSYNYAFFMENIFQLTKRWCVAPGLRYETISTASEGYYRLINKDLAGNILLDEKVGDNRSNTRSFLLAGIGTQLKATEGLELYANFSQNYRSINFNDMRVVNDNYIVDPNLRDENGYTIDGGFRGALKNLLYFDVNGFLLRYNNRLGTSLKVNPATSQIVRYRTNIGDSRSMGIEAFGELDWIKLINKTSKHNLSTFVNLSFINAKYLSSQAIFRDKIVEFAPEIIFRTGITYKFKKFGATCQYSYTDEQYTDATNAEYSSSAIYGIIPAYSIVDLSANYTYKKVGLIAGINNLTNSKYFTRRAEGYPGPGIIPADPINFYVTLRLTL
ncbi:TonB-dependent receptor domain-containing protein [Aurantibacillus circumpalustris]|uniref:TonB-dependent receptor domain-containing protein n=1 Tax=Aurantibacillus circumpalustris TaxID=3036359 RepID=UPI00295C19E0|nr:TonB-dependent receptor [Aurantibacillus circumpalustris]